jgi:hypothetical protein
MYIKRYFFKKNIRKIIYRITFYFKNIETIIYEIDPGQPV